MVGALEQAWVSPLLCIAEWGTDDADEAERSLRAGVETPVGTPEVAAEVLRRFGCDEEHITRRINYALTGDWTLQPRRV